MYDACDNLSRMIDCVLCLCLWHKTNNKWHRSTVIFHAQKCANYLIKSDSNINERIENRQTYKVHKNRNEFKFIAIFYCHRIALHLRKFSDFKIFAIHLNWLMAFLYAILFEFGSFSVQRHQTKRNRIRIM